MAAHRAPKLRQRTLIVGSGRRRRQLAERIQDHPELGLTLTGYIDDERNGGAPGDADLPYLGGLDALSDLVALEQVDRVMIAFTRAHHEELLHALRVCRDAGVAVDIVPRLFEFLDGARAIEQIGGMPLLSIDAPTFSAASRLSKRTLDVVGAGLLLLALAPLLALIAIAIKLDSRGPVLFTQQRSGRGGRFFKLYKFRSMHVDATVEVRDDGAIVKTRDDDRITRVGRFIRRFSLDEAPQLLNVLKGDMSLVGPRPLVLAEARALTEAWQARRADLRPGLTGPWQVSGPLEHPLPGHDPVRLPVRRRLVAGARHRDPARDAARRDLGPRRVLTSLIDLHFHALPGRRRRARRRGRGALGAARAPPCAPARAPSSPRRTAAGAGPPSRSTSRPASRACASCSRAAGIELELLTGRRGRASRRRRGSTTTTLAGAAPRAAGPTCCSRARYEPAGLELERTVTTLLERGHGIVLAHPERCPGVPGPARGACARSSTRGALCSITAGALAGRFGAGLALVRARAAARRARALASTPTRTTPSAGPPVCARA